MFLMPVKRDLEWLLNTTRMPIEVPESCAEVNNSVLFFGLPDIASISLQNPGDEQRLLRSLVEAGKCEDPHVERLLEGFAFLAARVYMKIDDEFPEVVESLLSILYPYYLRPIPSASVVS